MSLFRHFLNGVLKYIEKNILEQRSKEDFLAMSCVCRDSSMINPRLWIYSFATACLQRPDLKEFRMPAIWEIMPDQFVGPSVVRMAQQQAVLPKEDRVSQFFSNFLPFK